jgi:predicted DNA-binding protein
MRMFSERLQILISPEQRARWESEAKRRGTSVAGLIREAVDQNLGSLDRADRLQAVEAIRAMNGRFLTVDEMDRIAEGERARAGPR